MLLRISLIVAIIAGLAVAGLNMIMVKKEVTTLQTNLRDQTKARQTAEKERDDTRKTLDKTQKDLAATKAALDTTKGELEQANTEVANLTKKSDQLTAELTKTRKDRDDAQAELAAYTATGVTPPQIVAFNKEFKNLQDQLAGSRAENELLGKELTKTKNRLAIYETPDYQVPLPPGLRGKVVVSDPKWNFVVINVGENQGVLEQGELLVNRDGKLVAKVKVRSVQKDQSIANIMPGWQLGEVVEGDQVIPANPKS